MRLSLRALLGAKSEGAGGGAKESLRRRWAEGWTRAQPSYYFLPGNQKLLPKQPYTSDSKKAVPLCFYNWPGTCFPLHPASLAPFPRPCLVSTQPCTQEDLRLRALRRTCSSCWAWPRTSSAWCVCRCAKLESLYHSHQPTTWLHTFRAASCYLLPRVLWGLPTSLAAKTS